MGDGAVEDHLAPGTAAGCCVQEMDAFGFTHGVCDEAEYPVP